MKTFKTFIAEALPPHLQKHFKDKVSMGSVRDVTPSLDRNPEITVATRFRSQAMDLLKQQGIKFASKGSSTGTFSFTSEKDKKDAVILLKAAKVPVLVDY